MRIDEKPDWLTTILQLGCVAVESVRFVHGPSASVEITFYDHLLVGEAAATSRTMVVFPEVAEFHTSPFGGANLPPDETLALTDTDAASLYEQEESDAFRATRASAHDPSVASGYHSFRPASPPRIVTCETVFTYFEFVYCGTPTITAMATN